MALDLNYWDKDSESNFYAYTQEFNRSVFAGDVLGAVSSFERIQELFNRRHPEGWERYKLNRNLEGSLVVARSWANVPD